MTNKSRAVRLPANKDDTVTLAPLVDFRGEYPFHLSLRRYLAKEWLKQRARRQ